MREGFPSVASQCPLKGDQVYEFENDHNNLIRGTVEPKLQVDWSVHRAWHGETVKILVRSECVKDGSKIRLEIKPRDESVIEILDKDVITGNKLDKDYTINWKDHDVAADAKEFVVTAVIPDFALIAVSPSLYVDLVPPMFSA
jgi:hypothetical protein